MTPPTPPLGFIAVLQDRLQRLAAERAQLVSAIEEIDAKFLRIAQEMGVEDVSDLTKTTILQPKVDMRRAGSLVEFLLKRIEEADNGYTRGELKKLVAAHPEFGPKLERNENSFYNAVNRSIAKKEITPVGEKLYWPSKAPAQPEPSEAPNVRLFPTMRGGDAV